MRSLPLEDSPVSTIFSEYANDQVSNDLGFVIELFSFQSIWIGDFIPTFEKMMRNGYTDTELVSAPHSWENVLCLPKKGITCSLVL